MPHRRQASPRGCLVDLAADQGEDVSVDARAAQHVVGAQRALVPKTETLGQLTRTSVAGRSAPLHTLDLKVTSRESQKRSGCGGRDAPTLASSHHPATDLNVALCRVVAKEHGATDQLRPVPGARRKDTSCLLPLVPA